MGTARVAGRATGAAIAAVAIAWAGTASADEWRRTSTLHELGLGGGMQYVVATPPLIALTLTIGYNVEHIKWTPTYEGASRLRGWGLGLWLEGGPALGAGSALLTPSFDVHWIMAGKFRYDGPLTAVALFARLSPAIVVVPGEATLIYAFPSAGLRVFMGPGRFDFYAGAAGRASGELETAPSFAAVIGVRVGFAVNLAIVE